MRYKLTAIPAHLDDPAWANSTSRGPVYVGAKSEREARRYAAKELAPGNATKGNGTKGNAAKGNAKGEKPRSPWLDPALTDCSEESEIAGEPMLRGEVIAAD